MQTNDLDELLEMQYLVDEEEREEEIPSEPTKVKNSERWPYIGITLSTISALFFSLVSVIVNYLVNVHPIQLSVYRFAGILLPAIPIVIWRNECLFPKGKRLMLFLRSSFGAASVITSFYAIRHMPIADATVLIFSVPVFAAIFARLFLKEPCGLFHVIAICLTLIGIIFITRPRFIYFNSSVSTLPSDQKLAERSFWAPVAALSSALITANAYIFLRSLKDIHFSVTLVNFGGFGLILSLTTAWDLDVLCWPQCGAERLLTVAVGLFSFAGQYLMTLAFKLEQAGPVSIARSSDIVFTFLWQIVFFEEVPNWYSIAGAFLVTASVFLIGIRTWIMALPETSMLRKIFSIFEI